jgi:MoxR-like ATPase
MPALVYRFQEQECRFPLKDRTAIGRSSKNDLCLPCGSVSARHAVITRDASGYQLEDAGSENGIVVAGERVLSCPLRDGTVFALGEVEFAFTLEEGPGAEGAGAEAPEAALSPARSEEVIARFEKARERVLGEIGKVIVGQREVINQMLVALFARGHCLLIGVPGLAKTLMVRTLGAAVDLQSRRIQFTPDLMPSDITGTDILEEDSVTGKRAFRFHRGPIFSNLLLADEINRTPPKTQAALLEAMQEQRVTISGTSYDLPSPFMVLATQNPIEQEGTYPLPEAQLDRFMFCIHLAYPSAQEEQQVILDTTRDAPVEVERVLNAAQVLELQQLVRQVPVSQHVALYALSLVRATRPKSEGSLDFVNRWVNWGAGTRAGQYLLLAAKTHVLLQGRFSVSCADVREHALPVLRHRIFPTFTAASESVDTDEIVKRIVTAVKEPQY